MTTAFGSEVSIPADGMIITIIHSEISLSVISKISLIILKLLTQQDIYKVTISEQQGSRNLAIFFYFPQSTN